MASSATGTMYRAVLVASLYACAFVVLVGEDYLLKMVATESRMNRSFYSEDVAKAAKAPHTNPAIPKIPATIPPPGSSENAMRTLMTIEAAHAIHSLIE